MDDLNNTKVNPTKRCPFESGPLDRVDLDNNRSKNYQVNDSDPAYNLKKIIVEHLEAVASAASSKRITINPFAQEGYFWELKATFYLYYEARSFVQSIPDQCTVSEFKQKLKKEYRKKGNNWGYGCNWSESIQRFVMKPLINDLESYVGELFEGISR